MMLNITEKEIEQIRKDVCIKHNIKRNDQGEYDYAHGSPASKEIWNRLKETHDLNSTVEVGKVAKKRRKK